MKKLFLLSVYVISGLALSACGSSSIKTVGQESYTKTLDKSTTKLPKNLAQCVDTNLKAYRASSYILPRTTDMWDGAVPSIDSDQPQATIEIFLPTHSRGQIHAHIKVHQRQPIDEEINEAIQQCL